VPREPDTLIALPRSFTPEDMAKLFRHPKKGDPLVPSPAALERYEGNPADACAFGYRRAAEVLVEYTQTHGNETFLFYPIVFMYRHYVELMLKKLIVALDEPGIRRSPELSEEQRKKLCQGRKAHSLQMLWDLVRERLKALGTGTPEDIEGVNFYIRQLDEIDPGAVSFRYTNAIEETKARLKKAQKAGLDVDIHTFAEAMDRLANYLEGVDNQLWASIEVYNEMVAECCDSAF
jgi:hypothetical protein